MSKTFKDIENYEGLYQVTSEGEIYSVPRIDRNNVKRGGIYLTPNKKKNAKYLRVGLYKNNDYKLMLISHLVAKAFPEICGQWFDGCEVHHINYDVTDNRAENLIVLSSSEHKKYHSNSSDTYMNRSISQKKAWTKRTKRATNKKAVMQFDVDGKYIASYQSLQEAGEKTNTNIPSLCSCLRGNYKTAGGYVWKYVNL